MPNMASMSQNSSTSSMTGFSVYQLTLGASLQFHPAIGTPELDDMIHAYIPGPASIKDKRAAITMDFCDFARRTGEIAKFYPVSVSVQPFGASASTTSSPASSMQDSGYGSAFTESPVISNWNWSQLSSISSPSVSTASRKSSSAAPRTQATDFSHLPGMKIMTRDGRDVTNSASRGCKTKEQRDHAHLMRIIKACEACRRKKIRCDPNHRRQKSAQPEPQSRPIKCTSQASRSSPLNHADAAPPPAAIGSASGQFDTVSDLSELFDSESAQPDLWDQFVQFDEEPANLVSFDYDFYDFNGQFSPQSAPTVSSNSPSQPLTPASQFAPVGVGGLEEQKTVDVIQSPGLPYTDHGGPAHNYVDFNLYSPASSFLGDEDLSDIAAVDRASSSQYTSLPRNDQCQSSPGDYCPPVNLYVSSIRSYRQVSDQVQSTDRPGLVPLEGVEYSWLDPGSGGDANVIQNLSDGVPVRVTKPTRSAVPFVSISTASPVVGRGPLSMVCGTMSVSRKSRLTSQKNANSQRSSSLSPVGSAVPDGPSSLPPAPPLPSSAVPSPNASIVASPGTRPIGSEFSASGSLVAHISVEESKKQTVLPGSSCRRQPASTNVIGRGSGANIQSHWPSSAAVTLPQSTVAATAPSMPSVSTGALYTTRVSPRKSAKQTTSSVVHPQVQSDVAQTCLHTSGRTSGYSYSFIQQQELGQQAGARATTMSGSGQDGVASLSLGSALMLLTSACLLLADKSGREGKGPSQLYSLLCFAVLAVSFAVTQSLAAMDGDATKGWGLLAVHLKVGDLLRSVPVLPVAGVALAATSTWSLSSFDGRMVPVDGLSMAVTAAVGNVGARMQGFLHRVGDVRCMTSRHLGRLEPTRHARAWNLATLQRGGY
jgi:hypothetical protein